LQTFTKGRNAMFWINREGQIYRVSIVRWGWEKNAVKAVHWIFWNDEK
jgi:hypothetical protein